MRPALVLALDTSTPQSRVALVDRDSGALGPRREAMSERHSANLMRLVAEVLDEAEVRVDALAGIACGGGPGSFTGLRVGLAVAKGLALPTDVPLVLVSSLAALALDLGAAAAGLGEGVPAASLLLPCIDGGKGQVFVAPYPSLSPGDLPGSVQARSLLPEAVGTLLPAQGGLVFGGPGAARYRSELARSLGARARYIEVAGPTALAVARLGTDRLRRGERDDLATAVPDYGRPPDITRPKSAR
jgi:tRNA threonylcarbamoyladenosine biosynthesis protein TsaB